MTLRERVGTAYKALRGDVPKATAPKEKSGLSGLGAGFLELFSKPLQSEKNSDSALIRAFYGDVYANVSAIAEEVSKLEPELYKVRFEKGEIVYDRVLQHPVLDLLDRFNDVNTASEAFYITQADLELAGDVFYLKDNPTQPTELYLLDPTCVTVEPREDRFGVKQYIYEYTVNGKRVKKVYAPELILPIKTPNPENPLRGKSVVAAAGVAIDTGNMAQEFLKMFFKNGAVVSFALTSDQRITPDQIRQIKSQLKQEYGGVKNAFKALILGGGFKPAEIQHSNKDMAVVELLTAMRDRVMMMFKNTKASLGIVEDVNRANAEASLASWKNSVIKPKMTRIVDALNEYLVPDYGDNLVLGFKDPVPEDREAKITEASGLVNKVITVNEARTMLGYTAIPDKRFDELISERERQEQEARRFEDKAKPKALENVSLERHLRRQGVYTRYEAYKALYVAARELGQGVVARKRKTKASRYRSYSEAEAERYWQKQASQAELVEQHFTQRLDSYLKGIEDKAVARLAEHVTQKGALKPTVLKAHLVDEEAEVQAALDLFTPLLEDIAELSGVTAYELLSISRIYTPTRTMHETIRQYVGLMASSVVSTDRDKLERILTEGLDQGQSTAELERRIRSEFSEFRRNQSTRIARTEVLRASNAGTLDAYRESGVVSKAQWYTARDDRVDPVCAELDGKIVALGRRFFNDDYATGTQPPIHPSCRCTLLPVLDDEKTLQNRLATMMSQLEAA